MHVTLKKSTARESIMHNDLVATIFGGIITNSDNADPGLHSATSLEALLKRVQIEKVIHELEVRGVTCLSHSAGTYLDHLLGVSQILLRWGLPQFVCLAGLCHSVYGNCLVDYQLFSPRERARLRALIGQAAERLVYLFCNVDRPQLYARLEVTGKLLSRSFGIRDPRRNNKCNGVLLKEAAGLLAIEIANVAEQAHAGDLSPGIWIRQCARWAVQFTSISQCALPPFRDTTLTKSAERQARQLYRLGVGERRLDKAEGLLLQAATLNPLIGEPLLVAAYLASRRSDHVAAARRARQGLARLRAWGTPWDKRVRWERWLELGEAYDSTALRRPK